MRVTFDTDFKDGDKVYAGTFEADPLYNQSQNDPNDIAVVTLDRPVNGIAPAALPRANSLSGLPWSQKFTSVGYGAYEVTNQPGGHAYLYNDVRMVAVGTLNSINPAWLRISMNPSTGNGGSATATRAGRTSSVPPTSLLPPRSPVTPSADQQMWTTGSTRQRHDRSSASSSHCPEPISSTEVCGSTGPISVTCLTPHAATKLRSGFAPVAQGIEHRFPKPQVAGSNPAGGALRIGSLPGETTW